ncbi:MAG TPA: DinB family protein [Anaerolineaceae bacterium]|nr:DinB family protein [Anaerolineaceae bacterium]
MITTVDFTRSLHMENQIIHEQTKDLSQADTLIQPQPGGNCMNWVLGHTLDNQVIILELLGGRSPVSSENLERYRRDSDPVTGDGPGVWTLEELLSGHDRVQQAIAARLQEMDKEDFMQEVKWGERTVTLGWRVFFYYFHFTYHVGQLELLRNLAGHTEKVI